MRPRIQPALLRQMTVRRLLEALRERGPSSRADLTRATGISAPTVSKAVLTLLEAGLVEEGDPPAAAVGRPGRLLALASRTTQVLGVVLEPTHCRVTLASLDGRLHDGMPRTVTTPDDYDALLDLLTAECLALLADSPLATLGVGVSTPGLMDHEDQRVLLSPNLPCTNGRQPAKDLGECLGLAAVMVQESHALCLAERTMGGAVGKRHFAMIDASSGLGLGVMESGSLVLGHRGLAGEFGHMIVEPDGHLCGCGNRGCLETVATDRALARLMGERLGRDVDIHEALELLAESPADFAAETCAVGARLAGAVAAVVNIYNPSAVFVYSRWLRQDAEAFERVREHAERDALGPSRESCTIALARGDKTSGAVAGALHHLMDAPSPAASRPS